jgi:hypothetical protein
VRFSHGHVIKWHISIKVTELCPNDIITLIDAVPVPVPVLYQYRYSSLTTSRRRPTSKRLNSGTNEWIQDVWIQDVWIQDVWMQDVWIQFYWIQLHSIYWIQLHSTEFKSKQQTPGWHYHPALPIYFHVALRYLPLLSIALTLLHIFRDWPWRQRGGLLGLVSWVMGVNSVLGIKGGDLVIQLRIQRTEFKAKGLNSIPNDWIQFHWIQLHCTEFKMSEFKRSFTCILDWADWQ